MSKSSPYKRRHPNGTWYIHWTENRIGKRVSTGAKTEAEADRFLAEWILTEGLLTDRSGVTVADCWSIYRDKHVATKVAGVENADMAWRQMEGSFGRLFVSVLSQDHIDEYVQKRTSGRLGRKVKPQTAAKELSYMLAAIRFCGDPRRQIVASSDVKRFDLPEPGQPRDRWLRDGERKRLLDTARQMVEERKVSWRGELFIWIALETAARQQAILDLTWDRVDFETGMLVLEDPGRRKTKKGRATIPISNALRPVLKRAKAEAKTDLVMGHKGKVWSTIQRIAIAAGFSDQTVQAGAKPKSTGISPHVFRHTAATMMARRGVSLYLIAKVLGNSHRMVEKHYAKHQPDDLLAPVNMISGEAA